MDDGILVVGGRTGIGAAVAEWYGARATVWSRRVNGVDATDAGSVERAARAHLDVHGPPWALVHAVGDFDERPLLDDPDGDAHCRHMLDSNLVSAHRVARAVVPAMVAAGRGGRVLWFAASGAGDAAAKSRASLYFAAKAALVSLARSLALEVAPAGITVNVISPGVIRHAASHGASQERMQGRVPLGRPGSVDDLRGAVELLLGVGGGYITGEELGVDGGLHLLGASN